MVTNQLFTGSQTPSDDLIEWVETATGKGLGLAQKSINADVVAADRSAFERLGARHLRYR